MNHVYRLVWNSGLMLWQVASETARGGRGTRGQGRRVLPWVALLALGGLPLAQAVELPQGGAITAGTGSIIQNGNQLTIQQGSSKLAIDWQRFSIGEGGQVSFIQPGADAIALNRVLGQDPSRILGNLSANGQVFLLNPNGILFGGSAQVDVGGLVASTLDLANDDFVAGRYRFTGGGPRGGITNQGSISAGQGGYAALLAPEVSNQGAIRATLGTVLLGAGDQVTLQLAGHGLVGYTIDKGALRALAENRQLIAADGGQVILTARAADALSQAVVNNTGVVQARRIAEHGGKILLLGDMDVGVAQVAGTLDASAPGGGDGGFIETSAARVKVADEATITTAAPQGTSGTWLIDPGEYVIAPSGGDMTGAALSANLAKSLVLIVTGGGVQGSGDILVNDTVTWSANRLTLSAYRNIEINKPLNGSGNAKLTLEYGQGASNGVIDGVAADYIVRASVNLPAGQNFRTKLGSGGASQNYTVITDLDALQGISDMSGLYALGADLTAGGADFTPLAQSSMFLGQFHGLGHVIDGLTINRPTDSDVGLFRVVGTSGVIRDVGLTAANVTGLMGVGGLAAVLDGGTIRNSYVTGSVQGRTQVGGLVGRNHGNIRDSHASADVTGTYNKVGGLVGNNNGNISNAYATGKVTGTISVGGLVGENHASVSNAYATGKVTGTIAVGGLVGDNYASVSNAYATGEVTGTASVGGLVGDNSGTVLNSFWNTQTSGQSDSAGGVGLSTAEMTQSWPYLNAGWSMSGPGKTWGRDPAVNGGYPVLCAFTPACVTTLTVDVPASSSVYGSTPGAAASASTWLEGGKLTPQALAAMGLGLSGTASLSGVSNFSNVGNYNDVRYVGGLTPSGANAADFTLVAGTGGAWTVTPASLVVQANYAAKTYDGLGWSGGNGVSYSGFVNGEDESVLGGSLSYGGSSQGAKNAGNYTITPTGLTSGNYAITYQSNNLVINPRMLNATASRSYDGTNQLDASLFTLNNLVAGETLTLQGTGYTPDKNVGSHKPVSVGSLSLGHGSGLAANYSLQDTSADITPAQLAVTGASAQGKVYDGTTLATISGGALGGTVFNGDDVHLSNATQGSFADKNAGTGKAVTMAAALAGADAGNYVLAQQNGLSADITPAPLAMIGASAQNKVYDGTTLATISGGALGGTVFNGDDVHLSNATQGSFADKNAGTGKAVITAAALAGADAGNYVLAQQNGLSADITPASLTLSAVADSRTYNGGAASIGQVAVSGLQTGDSLRNLGQRFDSKNVGSRQLLVEGGYVIDDGNGGRNYVVTTESAGGFITPAALTLSAVSDTRPYTGTTASRGQVAVSGLQAGDRIGNLVQRFDSSAIGSRMLAVEGGYVIEDGNGGQNYVVSLRTAEGRITRDLGQEGALVSILSTAGPGGRGGLAAGTVAETPAGAVRRPAPLWHVGAGVRPPEGQDGPDLESDGIRLPEDYRGGLSTWRGDEKRRLVTAAISEPRSR